MQTLGVLGQLKRTKTTSRVFTGIAIMRSTGSQLKRTKRQADNFTGIEVMRYNRARRLAAQVLQVFLLLLVCFTFGAKLLSM